MPGLGPQLFPGWEDSAGSPKAISASSDASSAANSAGPDVAVSARLGDPRPNVHVSSPTTLHRKTESGMSTACEIGLALMTTCATLPPSGPPVEVTLACIRKYTREEREAAIECAAENNIAWRIVRRKSK